MLETRADDVHTGAVPATGGDRVLRGAPASERRLPVGTRTRYDSRAAPAPRHAARVQRQLVRRPDLLDAGRPGDAPRVCDESEQRGLRDPPRRAQRGGQRDARRQPPGRPRILLHPAHRRPARRRARAHRRESAAALPPGRAVARGGPRRQGRRGRRAAGSISAASSGGTSGPNGPGVGRGTIWGRAPGAPSAPFGPPDPFAPVAPSAASAQRRLSLSITPWPPLPPLPPFPPGPPPPPGPPGLRGSIKPARKGFSAGTIMLTRPPRPPLPPGPPLPPVPPGPPGWGGHPAWPAAPSPPFCTAVPGPPRPPRDSTQSQLAGGVGLPAGETWYGPGDADVTAASARLSAI